MTSILDVAQFFLEKSEYGMSTMKLQKLCYYAQGWHLAFTDQPMFPETFEAWRAGPVSYALFDKHRGMYSVHRIEQGDPSNLSNNHRVVAEGVYSNYGALTGVQLSELSHAPGGPWDMARQEAGAQEGAWGNHPIDQQVMRDYFYKTLRIDELKRAAAEQADHA